MKPAARIAHLFRCTAGLTRTNRGLREVLENLMGATNSSAQDHSAAERMLEESRELQQHLLDVTRQVLTSGEEEHQRIGGALQDELLQSLIGIHIRLRVLNKQVTLEARAVHKQIASTRRKVRESWQGLRLDGKAVAAKHAN